MHSSFAALREAMPMDCQLQEPRPADSATAADIARVTEIWRECRARFGQGGAFLFGQPGIADAMYAPAVTRFHSYQVPLDPAAAAYRDAVLALPAMRDWYAAAARE
jgi:glutathione S-transferase